ncbi:MAG: hypothetical protein M3247_08705, partial [Thermoproteota archaeon]|nr:hypothetical protein [Thermoproteota archaeon]
VVLCTAQGLGGTIASKDFPVVVQGQDGLAIFTIILPLALGGAAIAAVVIIILIRRRRTRTISRTDIDDEGTQLY